MSLKIAGKLRGDTHIDLSKKNVILTFWGGGGLLHDVFKPNPYIDLSITIIKFVHQNGKILRLSNTRCHILHINLTRDILILRDVTRLEI